MSDNVLVLDNGAYSIKVGYAIDNEEPSIIPNCKVTRGKGERKTYIGDQINSCLDYSGLYYRLPFERGYLVDWETERECNTPTTNLIITEPCFNLPNIQTTYDEMIFEVYEFKSCFRTIAPWLCIQNDMTISECMLVIDSGYSFTHIIPFIMGKPVLSAIRRYWNMMDQTYVMNEVKETCCYVSKDFLGDLEICRKSTRNNSIVQEYVLPDYSKNPKGYVRERKASGRRNNYSDEQVLYMNNERFTVPEILFNPSDIGMDQAGIPEAIVASINSISPDTQGLFYENVLLVGGNSLFSGYKERIEKDLRVLAPSDYEIKIGIPDNPITYAWHGGSKFAKTNEFKDMSVTKSEYDEHGSNICLKKFDGRRKTRLGEAKPYDTLTNKEVKLILDHNFCSPNNLTGLLYRGYVYLVVLEMVNNIICSFHDLRIRKMFLC
ncbi:11716_t:CDS:10 [Entrophospora sp. SA101]|nr:11716_t:CDS:10 [Entrophospora sp. SA101]